jgi:hypothetical protein
MFTLYSLGLTHIDVDFSVVTPYSFSYPDTFFTPPSHYYLYHHSATVQEKSSINLIVIYIYILFIFFFLNNRLHKYIECFLLSYARFLKFCNKLNVIFLGGVFYCTKIARIARIAPFSVLKF